VREYSKEPLSIAELATLLHVTQGITEPGKRSAPSAGGRYPIETYIVANNVAGLESGLYHYLPEENALARMKTGDFSREMADYCSGQVMCKDAAVVFVWTAVFERTTDMYGSEGKSMVYIEAGHISENLYLQGNSMGIGVVAIGGFMPELIDGFLGVDGHHETTIYINSVGRMIS
ncbi:TPA: SagB/ThcOx family dehydrogenase, partial [Candidatus Woesearchaeota archaeon]|nr:SagB/ThcOx family dehydrogenase [Candidatus Woesearchaeota archaeon]